MLGNSDNTWGWPPNCCTGFGAILILLLLGHGWWMTHLAPRPDRLRTMSGTRTRLRFPGAAGARLLWRWTHAVPTLPADLAPMGACRRLASHFGLYLLMFASTLTGWALAGTFRTPLNKDVSTRPFRRFHQPGRAMHGLFEIRTNCCPMPRIPDCSSTRGALRHHLVKRNTSCGGCGLAHKSVFCHEHRALNWRFVGTPMSLAAGPGAGRRRRLLQGQAVRLLVGVGVGSGYDINARLSPAISPTHIPGNPTVIVQNQPGAGASP